MLAFDARLDLNWTGTDATWLQGASNVTPSGVGHYQRVKLDWQNPDTGYTEVVEASLVKNTSGATIAQYDLAQYASGSRINIFESTTLSTNRNKIAGVVASSDGLPDGYWGWVVVRGNFKGLGGGAGCTANTLVMSHGDDGAIIDNGLASVAEGAAVLGLALATFAGAATGYVAWDIP